MRIFAAISLCIAVAGCATTAPSSDAGVTTAQLAESLIGSTLNTTDPAVNRKVGHGPIITATSEAPCTLLLSTASQPAPLTIDLGSLVFLYEDDHDASIGLVQRGRGQPAISFFSDPARHAEILEKFEVATRACGSHPNRSEPLVMG